MARSGTLTNDELIEAYDRDQVRRGLLPATRAMRRRQLRLVSKSLGPFDQITHEQIDAWLDTRTARNGELISHKTRSCWLTSLSAFYDFITRAELFRQVVDGKDLPREYNPVKKIVRPRVHPKGPRPISEKALRRAIDAAVGILKCWLNIEALEGLRCQEVAYLAAEDIDRDRETLLVTHGKGDKERMLPLHPEVLAALDATPGLPTHGRLWPQATPSAVSQRINRHLHGLGIRDTAHSLRHFFGTRLYITSTDIRLTQALMGHSSPDTTSRYADFDQSKAAAAVSKLQIGGKVEPAPPATTAE